MKVVLDTNVLVSGLLVPDGPTGDILRMTAAGLLQLCYDARILLEYEAVLRRPKFPFRAADVAAFLEQVRAGGMEVPAVPLAQSLPDPSDEVFLEAALAGAAECLVTGNRRHFPAPRCMGVRVLTPSEFLEFYRRKEADHKP